MKKIFYIVLAIVVLVLVCGAVFVMLATNNKVTPEKVTNKTADPIKITADQQACITSKQQAAIKPAQETFNAATKDAMAVRQTAVKAAQDVLNAATPAAMKARQAAITAAQKITDPTAKAAAIKAANDAYNNDPKVKIAMVPYMAAVKAADTIFNNDATVKQAKIPYMAAIKAARAEAIKECTGTTVSFSQTIQGLLEKSTSALANAFTFTKETASDSKNGMTAQQACISTKTQAEIKPAQVIFNTATKNAASTRQAAVTAARSINDPAAKAAAIKAANEAFNNDTTVKQASPSYISAIRAIRTQVLKECGAAN